MKIQIKPLSVNDAWQGRRFKTPRYKKYEKDLISLLPKAVVTNHKLEIFIEFGFSSTASDIDNPLKPFLDILQKKYNINDKQIYSLNVKKTIVKKGSEFINFEIYEIRD
jgi:Holliday junction resolvase RusA-like endonuclease